MSRVIKFRAWDGERMITSSIMDNYDSFYTLDLDGVFYPHTRTGDEYFEFAKDELNKKSYVLMQFTGLRDKNGVEIYEGDILRDPQGLGVVHYTQPSFTATIEDGTPYALAKGMVNVKQLTETEVIGNIYQNPELLKT